MSSHRARHRAPVAPFAWASRALLTAATVPVGALAGCVVAAVSSSADRPEVGLAGLALAGVPLGVHGWRRRGQRTPLRGRHVAGAAGVAGIWPDAVVLEARAAVATAPAGAGALVLATAPVLAAPPLHLVPRLFTVSASQQVVEVVPGALPGTLPGTLRDAEVAELQRIWDSGTGPDTGALTAVPALPDVVAAVTAAGGARRRAA